MDYPILAIAEQNGGVLSPSTWDGLACAATLHQLTGCPVALVLLGSDLAALSNKIATEQGVDLLVAENPTRGLDVAATAFVHAELLGLRGGGEPGAAPGVVLISTDLDEILALSDRVFVLLRGVLHPVPREERSRTKVGALMVGAGETP